MREQVKPTDSVATTTDLALVQRKARYGHRSYLYWRGADGLIHYALYSHAAIKAAMLAVGCTGKFYWYDHAGTGHIARSYPYMIHLWRCAGGLTAARAARLALSEAR